MTTYYFCFRSNLQSGMRECVAETPKQALELVGQFEAENPINEIEICDDNGNELAIWYGEDESPHPSARDLLSVLDNLVEQRREAAEADLDGCEMTWLAEASAAIAEAKRGAP